MSMIPVYEPLLDRTRNATLSIMCGQVGFHRRGGTSMRSKRRSPATAASSEGLPARAGRQRCVWRSPHPIAPASTRPSGSGLTDAQVDEVAARLIDCAA
jgi:hypothetical protein